MLKIIANIGAWQTLYVSEFATARLKQFDLPGDWKDGLFDGFSIKILAKSDEEGPVKVHFIILVCERPEYASLISLLLRTDLGAQLKQMVMADRITQIVDENSDLVRYCRRIEEELLKSGQIAKNPPKKNDLDH